MGVFSKICMRFTENLVHIVQELEHHLCQLMRLMLILFDGKRFVENNSFSRILKSFSAFNHDIENEPKNILVVWLTWKITKKISVILNNFIYKSFHSQKHTLNKKRFSIFLGYLGVSNWKTNPNFRIYAK